MSMTKKEFSDNSTLVEKAYSMIKADFAQGVLAPGQKIIFRELTERYLSYLADGLANAVNIFSPELICLGGGVANEREENLLHPLQAMVAERTRVRQGVQSTRFVKAQLGGDAGIIGAALLDMPRI